MGCASSSDASPSGPRATTVDGVTVSAEDMKRGEFYFFRYCAGCHGPRGAGDGSRGRFSSVPPADLRAGKFRTARANEGNPPGDAFFRRVILEGIEGTVMKGLPVRPEELMPLIHYVKALDPSRLK